jgi:anthranilate phosphoribosyltransferase
LIREAIRLVVDGQVLSRAQACAAMGAIVDGQATPAQIAAFATALRMRGERAEELAGFVDAMRARAHRIVTAAPALDTCGTGGDGQCTLNISTAAAIVAAGAGATVAKHGNRAITSRCGSADVLESLGVKVDLDPESVRRCIDEIGIGFMFAPVFHPAMRHAAGARREIGIRTVFNLLGPLANPAGAAFQVVGVPSEGAVALIAGSLLALGATRAMVVHGLDGADELSVSAPTQVAEIRDGEISRYQLDPSDAGLPTFPAGSLAGGEPGENAARVRAVLEGSNGADRAAIVLNAAAALLVAGRVVDLREGADAALRSIASGAARDRLDAWVAHSRRLAAEAVAR